MMVAALMRLRYALRHAFATYPLIANSIVYGGLFVGAEISQQTLLRRVVLAETKVDAYDWGSVKRYGIVGTFLYSPLLTLWYKWLDKRLAGTAWRTVFRKLLLDQFVITPPLLALFFVVMSALETKGDVFEECRSKFLATYRTSCLFWLPAQTVNFCFVSPIYRVTYTATCAFAWVNILCYVKREKY